MSRRPTVLAALIAGVCLPAVTAAPSVAAAPAPPALRCAAPAGVLFTCTATTPGETSFDVPAGVRELHVRLVGAAGGRGAYRYATFEDGSDIGTTHWSTDPAPGGLGAEVRGDLSVGPDERLFLVVGGRGRDGGHAPKAAQTGLGGSNGGGAGGGLTDPTIRAGGGGGATDLRIGADGLVNRAVVAGGGGGAGSGGWFAATGADNDKTAVADGRPARCGGRSGHDRSGGVGVGAGLPGGFGVGGTGGTGRLVSPDGDASDFAGGGGGGGYGGGGGGAVADGDGTDTFNTGDAGCGGGGGSSLFKQRYAVRGSASSLNSTSAPAGVTLTYLLPGS